LVKNKFNLFRGPQALVSFNKYICPLGRGGGIYLLNETSAGDEDAVFEIESPGFPKHKMMINHRYADSSFLSSTQKFVLPLNINNSYVF
jgi:hypothetical protein